MQRAEIPSLTSLRCECGWKKEELQRTFTRKKWLWKRSNTNGHLHLETSTPTRNWKTHEQFSGTRKLLAPENFLVLLSDREKFWNKEAGNLQHQTGSQLPLCSCQFSRECFHSATRKSFFQAESSSQQGGNWLRILPRQLLMISHDCIILQFMYLPASKIVVKGRKSVRADRHEEH